MAPKPDQAEHERQPQSDQVGEGDGAESDQVGSGGDHPIGFMHWPSRASLIKETYRAGGNVGH